MITESLISITVGKIQVKRKGEGDFTLSEVQRFCCPTGTAQEAF